MDLGSDVFLSVVSWGLNSTTPSQASLLSYINLKDEVPTPDKNTPISHIDRNGVGSSPVAAAVAVDSSPTAAYIRYGDPRAGTCGFPFLFKEVAVPRGVGVGGGRGFGRRKHVSNRWRRCRGTPLRCLPHLVLSQRPVILLHRASLFYSADAAAAAVEFQSILVSI